MKIRHPALIRCLAFFGAWAVRGWMNTLRYRLDFRASGPHPADPHERRCIYAFWHESLLFATHFRTRIHVLISQHADGELIARVCRHLGFGVVRGSSRRGGGQGLLDMLHKARTSHLAITPDGPRGPRRRVQLGTVFLAAHTGLPVVPVGVGYARAWRAPSWDSFAVPLPYSTAVGVVAPPVCVPGGLDHNGLEHYRRVVEDRLLTATEAAERWAEGRPRLIRVGDRPPGLRASA